MKPPFRSDNNQLRKIKIRYEVELPCFVLVEGKIDKQKLVKELDKYACWKIPPIGPIKIVSNRKVKPGDPSLSDQFCALFDDMDMKTRADVIFADRNIDRMISNGEIDLPDVCPHCGWDFDDDPENYDVTWSTEDVEYICGACYKRIALYTFKTPTT